MTELYWHTPDGSYTEQRAVATSIIPDNGQLVVVFKGKTSDGAAYEGVVRLPLSLELSPATGSCITEGKDTPFQLMGSFQDQEYTQYEGTWLEGTDYIAKFSFDTAA